jgi:cytochrome c-type biogenesis protein CcmH
VAFDGIFIEVMAMFGRGDSVSSDLRELLRDRADGKIDEEEFGRRQAALHARVLESKPGASKKRLWLAIPIALVAAGIGFYVSHGTPDAIDVTPAGPMGTRFGTSDVPKAANPQANTAGDLSVLVKGLAEKMAKNPGDGDGWLLLARTYRELHQPKEASAAYAKAAALLPPDATMLADWADAHVMANGGKWDIEAKDIVKRALRADSKHLKALALAGSEAFEHADYKSAIAYWKRMRAVAPAGSMDAKLAEANIQEAEGTLSGKKPAASADKPPNASGTAIVGTVSLSPKLKGQVAPTDAVFVVAKEPDGRNPPLAVKRFSASDLPLHFALDDSAAMVPGRTLSQFRAAIVSARISKTGNAMPAAGDIEAKGVLAKLGGQEIKLELSSVH